MTIAIGIAAAALSIASFVPQAWKIWRTRNTSGLSTAMWTFNTIAFALWVAYGIALGELPIIVPNAICFLLAGFILKMKLTARS